MKPDFLNRFMDINSDGKIDLKEEFLGFQMMNEVLKDEDDGKTEKAEDDDLIGGAR